MPLIPRIKIADALETPEGIDLLVVMTLFGERLGTGQGREVIAHDKRDADGMHDVLRAHLRRANLSAVVHRHNCPHVPGFEEPTWTACIDPAYDFTAEIVS